MPRRARIAAGGIVYHVLNRRNERRARLVDQAQQWPWSSLGAGRLVPGLLAPAPVAKPPNWPELINQPIPRRELGMLRQSVTRGRPYGPSAWMERTAQALNLTSTLRPRGRPKKAKKAHMMPGGNDA